MDQTALEAAEYESLADEEALERRRRRDEVRRAEVDLGFQADFAKAIQESFPGCPPERAAAIAAHAALRGSGRVGRSAAGRQLEPQAVTLAVVASIRHSDTRYDSLLMAGVERTEARAQVRSEVDRILAEWSAGRSLIAGACRCRPLRACRVENTSLTNPHPPDRHCGVLLACSVNGLSPRRASTPYPSISRGPVGIPSRPAWRQMRRSGATADFRPQPPGESATPALVITADSLVWRRRVGSLAWTALQQLALSSHHTEQGWVAPVGVRDVAQGLRVTKDTAARAVSTLITAGLVTRNHVEVPGRRRRPGYILRLPAPMWLIGDPKNLDGIRNERAGCPNGEDSTRSLEDAGCPEGQYSPDRKADTGPRCREMGERLQPALSEEASRLGAVVDIEARRRSS